MIIDDLNGLIKNIHMYIRDKVTNEPELVTGIVLEIIDDKPAICLITE